MAARISVFPPFLDQSTARHRLNMEDQLAAMVSSALSSCLEPQSSQLKVDEGTLFGRRPNFVTRFKPLCFSMPGAGFGPGGAITTALGCLILFACLWRRPQTWVQYDEGLMRCFKELRGKIVQRSAQAKPADTYIDGPINDVAINGITPATKTIQAFSRDRANVQASA